MALAVALLSVACLLSLTLPLVIQALVDQLTLGAEVPLATLIVGLALFFLAQAAVTLGNTLVLGRVSLNVVRDLAGAFTRICKGSSFRSTTARRPA